MKLILSCKDLHYINNTSIMEEKHAVAVKLDCAARFPVIQFSKGKKQNTRGLELVNRTRMHAISWPLIIISN